MSTAAENRERDRYGRAIFAAHEVPPVDAGLSLWRGGITKDYPPNPGNQVGGCHPTEKRRRPYAECFHGWVRSLDWWMHCADCHPAPEPRCPRHSAYPQPCAVCSFGSDLAATLTPYVPATPRCDVCGRADDDLHREHP